MSSAVLHSRNSEKTMVKANKFIILRGFVNTIILAFFSRVETQIVRKSGIKRRKNKETNKGEAWEVGACLPYDNCIRSRYDIGIPGMETG